jgi:hypothetical protein
MTTVFLSSPVVTVNSVELTDQCTSATFSQSVDALEKTVFGNVARLYTGGLETNELVLEMFLDYDSGDVWATLNGLVGVATTVKVKADAGAASATNPELTLDRYYARFTTAEFRFGRATNSKRNLPRRRVYCRNIIIKALTGPTRKAR